MKILLTAVVLLITVVSAMAQKNKNSLLKKEKQLAYIDSVNNDFFTHIREISKTMDTLYKIPAQNYQYSYIEYGYNRHTIDVHTKFNIHNNDSLRFIIEDIDGVETITTWKAYKYSFLVIVGEMFDPEKVAAIIQSRIEYFATPKKIE